MNNPTTKEPEVSGHFIAMLQSKTGGVTLTSLDAELASLVKQVRESGRPGKLTYTLKVSRNAKAGVKVEDDIKMTPPKPEADVSFFYVADNGALLRNDPNQHEIKFETVAGDAPSAPKVING